MLSTSSVGGVGTMEHESGGREPAVGVDRPRWSAALEESQRRANERRDSVSAAQRRRERREATLVAGWLRELTKRT